MAIIIQWREIKYKMAAVAAQTVNTVKTKPKNLVTKIGMMEISDG